MNPERVKELFAQALAKPAPAREAFLNAACTGDPDLRKQLDSLLAAHEQAGDFLGQTLKLPEPDFVVEPTGTMIGRYKLLEKIGEGGFGVVYMAEQVEPVQRKVALKVIKAGMDTKEVIARFEAERQALALMDHPNIAKVLDAGTTVTRRPFFVMELVRGIPITEYCDLKEIPTHKRLQLFMKVCQAVQHAHQKGIIHRDLKPSNVLVTLHDGEPVPKVIDFGVAKALGQKLTEKTLFTGFAHMIGTPAYMSPEQADLSGLDIDTRSDIYSLGVLLYELLTGVTPFDKETFARAALDEIRRMIRETEPLRPSTRLESLGDKLGEVAKHRNSEPAALQKLVRGDLDWIVMKCLEKDRGRRYETANGVAMDLLRHLSQEPVVARPPSAAYRFEKLVRRNKLGFAAVAAVSGTLVLGAVVSATQAVRAVRAEREQGRLRQQAEAARATEASLRADAETNEKRAEAEAAKSQQVARFLKEMLEGIDPTVAQGRDTTLLREILDKTAERVGKDLVGQPEVEAELRSTIAEVYRAIGAHSKAERSFREVVVLLQKQFGREDLKVANALEAVARALVSQVAPINFESMTEQDLAKLSDAEGLAREALAIRQAHLGDEHLEVAQSLHVLASVLDQQQKFDQAAAFHRSALALRRKLLGEEHALIAESLVRIVAVLRHQQKLEEAEQLSRQALAMRKKLFGDEHLLVATSAMGLARALKALSGRDPRFPVPPGVVLDGAMVRSRLAESEALHREALVVQRRLLGNEHPETAYVLASLGDVLWYQGKLDETESTYREALVRRRQVFDRYHPQVSATLLNLFRVISENRRADRLQTLIRAESAAMAVSQQSADRLRNWAQVLEQEHWHLAANLLFREAAVLLQKVIANEPTNTKALYALANVLERQGKLTDAEAATSKALAIQQSALGREHPDFAAGLELLAHLFLSQHKLTEAEPLCRESLATRKKLGLAPELAAQSANSLATVLIGQGKAFEAETLLRDELSALERKIPENWEIFRARSLLGSSLMEQSKSADAEPWLARGYEGMKLRQRTIPHEYLPELKRAWSGLLSYYLTNGQAGTIKSREIRLELMHSRGEQFARHARWQEAIAEFSKAVELAPDEHDAYHALSPMLVQVGDLDGYKRHRSAVLDRFGGTTDPLVAERMAKDCLILPSSEAELTRISKLADSAVARGPNHWALPFFQFAKGLAEYRQGQFSSAAELMQKVLATRGIPFREAQAQLVLAMANNQLQKHEAARAALLKGVEIVETKLPRLESSDLGDGWNDVLIAHALLREARALIEGN